MKQFVFCTLIVLTLLTTSGMSGCTSFKSNQAIEHYNVGKTLQDERKYDEAIAEFNEAIKINPVFTDAYISRGYTYILKAKYDLAIVDYTKAISLDPNNPIAFNGRGAAYLYTKQFNLALQDYYRSMELKPGQEQIQKNIDYCKEMLDSMDDGSLIIESLTGEWVSAFMLFPEELSYGLEMFDGMGTRWFYDVVMSVVEDSSGNLKGAWTQTLLKVVGPAASLEEAEKYWNIGVPDKYSITGRRNGKDVQLDFGGRIVPLVFYVDSSLGDYFLTGEKNYFDYGSPVGSTPKYYEELHPELGSLYIEWTYSISLRK